MRRPNFKLELKHSPRITPRIYGEDQNKKKADFQQQESPPYIWGKPAIDGATKDTDGITPVHMGKTLKKA